MVRTSPSLSVRGVIFDLDGTLVDSGLDFDAMRREMGLPPGQPLLEAIESLPEQEAQRCQAILARHEWEGANRATLMPGVADFLGTLAERGVHRAIFTRNARDVVLATLARLALDFDTVVAREDAPAKPDPTAVWQICAAWQLAPSAVALIGDFRFDIEAGNRAGVRTVLYTAGAEPLPAHGALDADYCLRSFEDAGNLLAWLAEPL
ncbi:MAG TPA: HAD family hydrolase [Gemmataceae bacterium]|nr:HAD family hydrolase [Pirellulales bacterium]HZZ81428.1 HAD family hydrolase [Gemmataceae bacterium]